MKKPAAKAKAAPKAKQPAGGKPAHAGAVKSGTAAKSTAKAAKPAAKKAAKPAHVSAKVKAARHASAVKASKTRAANAKKARQLALGEARLRLSVLGHPALSSEPRPSRTFDDSATALSEAVACCSAEALAASLRLSGWPVSDADVLALYLHTTRDLDAGAPILATLEAAGEFGLAGVRPVSFAEVMPDDELSARSVLVTGAGLILGLDLPGPHAVLDTGSEWITWGESWAMSEFPDVVIEEAWTVEWGEVGA